jgi:signal-transduction protein with cAMP-binding, CBS, and nucleotidyltransferase domain
MDPIEEELTIAEERSSQPPTITPDVLEEPISSLCEGPAVSVPMDATVGDAIRAMQEHRIGSVLVVDGDDLLGIVTERDVLMKATGRDLSVLDAPVTRIMTADPETLRVGDRVIFLMNKMHVGGFRHVPIVDDAGKPLHVLSLRAVLRYFIEQFGSRVVNLPPEPFRGERKEASG